MVVRTFVFNTNGGSAITVPFGGHIVAIMAALANNEAATVDLSYAAVDETADLIPTSNVIARFYKEAPTALITALPPTGFNVINIRIPVSLGDVLYVWPGTAGSITLSIEVS